MDQIIKFINVTKKYGDHIVLNDINLTINKGEKVLIIGSSGSGKSTFLRCINRLENIDNGLIEIQDVTFDKNNITTQIGMVFQHFNLFPHMNIFENLTYAPRKILNMSLEEAEDKAAKLLDLVELKNKIHSNINNLSGGQKQRIAIVRTLMINPKIILFDEPISALDSSMAIEVVNTIKNTISSDITILIVSHNVELIKNITTKTLLFENGKINENY